jgi:uncharacterized protein YegP (UPF0339 family)
MPRIVLPSLLGLVLLSVGFFSFTATPPARAVKSETTYTATAAAATFEMYKDKAGEYRWRLRMQNTKVIATSGEGYTTKRACEEAIDSVKKNAADAAVEEKEADSPPADK